MDIEKVKELSSRSGQLLKTCWKELLRANGDVIAASFALGCLPHVIVQKYGDSENGVSAHIWLSSNSITTAVSPEVITFANLLAQQVYARSPTTIEQFLKQPWMFNPVQTVEKVLQWLSTKHNDNIKIDQIIRTIR